MRTALRNSIIGNLPTSFVVEVMRRHFIFIIFLWAIVAACSASSAVPAPPVTDTGTAAVTEATAPTAVIPPTETATTAITEPATAAPTETASPTPTAEPSPTSPPPTSPPSPVPTDLSLTANSVYLYPAPDIYAGDRVTFQVLAHVPENVAPDAVTIHVLVNGEELADGTLGGRNLAGDAMGLFEWAWDTSGLAGDHTVEIVLDREDTIRVGDEDPGNNQAVLVTTVLDPAGLPAAQANATWVTAESNCCHVHVVSGTAAYRDLAQLLAAVDAAIQQAADRLDEEPAQKFDVYLIDRVIGQGGYAGSSMVISYLDRNYASNGLHEVLVHETTHLLDRQFAPQRITFLAEGLAVWAAGGHYKQEDIDQRAAALVKIERYVPLAQLVDNFYPVQHEIGYLEAAGFINYLIKTYGWPQFRAFYSDVTADDAGTLAQAVDANLQKHFGITLEEAETNWLAYLQALPEDRMVVVDLQTTIRYFDVMRQYQRVYDPTAYFLTAWLPYPQALRESGNPADLTRHPESDVNVTLEVMLQAADADLRAGNYQRANVLLDSVSRVLDSDGAFIDPLSLNYLNVVHATTAEGYEAHRVNLEGSSAVVWATPGSSTILTRLDLALSGRDWVLSD